MPLAFEEYGFDPRPRFPFFITMKHYPNLDSEQDGFTLVLTHGTGFHKELWEPIIERIFTSNPESDGLRIRDAWAIDAPNHGDAAILNAGLLNSSAYDFTCESTTTQTVER
jgi:pimeloyl-ACP methyl ester carboxylesterase